MEIVNPKILTDKVTSVISHVVVTTASKLAFISGQVSVDESGALIGSGTITRKRFKCSPILSMHWKPCKRIPCALQK